MLFESSARPAVKSVLLLVLLAGTLLNCCVEVCMAINLAIDPELLERVLELSGEKSRKAAVTMALKEFIARREQFGLLKLFGKLEWDPDFDYKEERTRR